MTQSHDGTASKIYTIEITKTKYTIYYLVGAVVVALVIAIPIIFYLKYVKPKKELVDINGNKIDKEELKAAKYRKKLDTTVPESEPKAPVQSNSTVVNPNVDTKAEPPKYAVNIAEGAPQQEAPAQDMGSSKCPKCGRELLGSPSICPYCNTKLR